MKKGKKTRWLYKAAGMAVLLGAAFWCSNSGLLLWKPEVLTVLAESESSGSLSSVTEEAKILPIPNSDGKYMLKSDGFYCLNEDGSGDCVQAIHYFDHFVVDGTVFNGYYYHDETGKFKASKAHLTAISQEALPKAEDGTVEAGWTSGIYVVNNLGRLSGTGRVCILKEEIGQIKLDGGYYVDRNGRVCQEGGIYYIQENDVSVTGMIDRAKLAKGYITDEYLKPYAIFKNDMKDTYVDEMEICSEFEEGIVKQEFQVFYQPVVDARTGKIVSAEALVRWLHEQKGWISPGQFIPALEKGGYISQLDRYMIEKVTGCLDQRRAEKKRFVPVSVNLSWMDFYDENMLEWIVRGLKKNNPNEQKIRFEITETSLAAIGENHTRMLMHLKENGAEILLDDFGSGYSSFGMLQDYDFDILKMDISFVRNIGVNKKSESILRAIIDMAHQLEIRLVAEGAETEEQVAFLRENGCDYIQGYYYYKPMPEKEFLKLLDEGK